MGHPELTTDKRANTGTARSANVEFLQPLLEGWLGTINRDEAVNTLNGMGLPCGPINDAEDVANDPTSKRGDLSWLLKILMLAPTASPALSQCYRARLSFGKTRHPI